MANSEDPDLSAHPRSLIRVFVVRLHNIPMEQTHNVVTTSLQRRDVAAML